MHKVALIALVLFVVAMVLPEVRPLLFVGGFGLTIGFMVGSQRTARHTAELHANRLERGAQSWQS